MLNPNFTTQTADVVNNPIAQPGALVILTRTMITLATGRILPAGTVGRVIIYKPTVNKIMVDFGIANYAQGVNPHSGDIELIATGGDNGR